MRLALLSALAEPPGAQSAAAGERPAFRRFAGKTVLAHQIDCAAHLQCGRVLCLASGAGPELGAARGYAERAGLRFETVVSMLHLASQITADDEVVLIAEGVLPDRAALVGKLAQGPAVLAFPENPALTLGFERLDATRAWSGALRTRGDCVARLADLPDDCDIASSLLRISLQSGVRVVELDPAPLDEATWLRRVDRNASTEAEWRWVARQVGPASFAAPGQALAERMGLRWARDAGGGRWARVPHLSALASGLLAGAAGLAGSPLFGLVALMVTSLGLAVAAMFDRVEALGARPRKAGRMLAVGGWLRDAMLAALLAMLIVVVPGWLGFVLPMLLVGVLVLGSASARPPLRALFGDRIALLALLLPASGLGWATEAVAGVTLIALALLLWDAQRRPPKLTAD